MRQLRAPVAVASSASSPAACLLSASPLPFPPPAAQVYDVLNADVIVVEKSALAYLNEWFGGEEEEAAAAAQ